MLGGGRNVNRGLLRNFRERGGGGIPRRIYRRNKIGCFTRKNMSSGANESRKKGERAVEQYK